MDNLVLSLICFLSCFAGVLLGFSLKGLLVMQKGLEKGQKAMFNIGLLAGAGALVFVFISIFIGR
jgi:hypothetical protein